MVPRGRGRVAKRSGAVQRRPGTLRNAPLAGAGAARVVRKQVWPILENAIGCKASVNAYSREVLAATFDGEIAALPQFPFPAQDRLIVPRGDPVDRRATSRRRLREEFGNQLLR